MVEKKEWDWEKEVENILKDGSFNSRLKDFIERFNEEWEEALPPEEWQEVLNAFFNDLLEEYPAFACCIFAFQAGQGVAKVLR